MKKLIALFALLAFSSNLCFAQVDQSKNIAKVFNTFTYKMTVANTNEAMAIADFKKDLAALQANGVSADAITSYIHNTIFDSTTRTEFDRAISTIGKTQLGNEDAEKLALQFLPNLHTQGASYEGNGSVAASIVGAVIGATFLTLIIISVRKRANSSNPTQPVQLMPWYVEE